MRKDLGYVMKHDKKDKYNEILDEIFEKISKEPKFIELVEKLAKS